MIAAVWLNPMITSTPSVMITGMPLAAASDSHRELPGKMATICHDWLTDYTTYCCFVVIGSL